MWKFAEKMPNASGTTSIEHRALTLTIRTSQCGHTVWGKNLLTLERHKDMSQERVLTGNCRTLLLRHPFCANLRSPKAHSHFTRAILYGNLQGKCRTLIPRPAFCSSLRSRNAQTFHKSHFVWKFTGKMPGQCFVRACAVEMHMDI